MVLEAARILRTLGIRPKRTIRFALWGAEEQGLLGGNVWQHESWRRDAGLPPSSPTDGLDPDGADPDRSPR